MSSKKETLLKEYNETVKAIKTVEKQYIKALSSIGYECLNNRHYTNKLDTLIARKEKLMYLIALE